MVASQKELDWNKDYLEGEFEADDVMLKPIVYKLFHTNYVGTLEKRKRVAGYVDYLVNAREAKNAIGPATNDGWVFTMLCELYMKACTQNKGKYQSKNHVINMLKLTPDDFKVLTFCYVQGLQDFVITGVKHNDNGSAGFELLYLRNFSKQKNQKELSSIFIKQMKLTSTQVGQMFAVINWAEESGVLLACKAFLRLYNKGVQPETVNEETKLAFIEHEAFIQENTFFGSLIAPVYEIRNKIKSKAEQAIAEIESNQIDFFNL
jgi:hypothetical protein